MDLAWVTFLRAGVPGCTPRADLSWPAGCSLCPVGMLSTAEQGKIVPMVEVSRPEGTFPGVQSAAMGPASRLRWLYCPFSTLVLLAKFFVWEDTNYSVERSGMNGV